MAFNPFHRFRKHQKVFFAILTIICMIVFIFSFGAADPIQQLLRKIGMGRNRGDQVTTLFGKKVYEIDVNELLRRRRMAHTFMVNAVGTGQRELLTQLANREKKAKPEEKLPVWLQGATMAISRVDIYFRFPQLRQSLLEERAQFRAGQPSSLNRMLGELRGSMRLVYSDMQPRPGGGPSPEEIKQLEGVAAILGFSEWLLLEEDREFYFGGTPRLDSLLDFMAWEHEADRLGATLTEEDLRREIVRSAGGMDVFDNTAFDSSKQVRSFLSMPAYRGASAADLRKALTDEFRVALTREGTAGLATGARAYRKEFGAVYNPAAPTPDQFLNYYRNQRTTLNVALLDLSVEKYLKKVPDGPDDPRVLEDLYEQYRDREPIPFERTPGFKQPRRVRVQYADADKGSSFYKEKARTLARGVAAYSDPAESAALRFLTPLTAFQAAGPLAAAAQVFPAAFDPLRKDYQDYERRVLERREKGFGSGIDFRDRKQTAASQAGQMLAAGLSPAGPVALLPAGTATRRLTDRLAVEAFSSALLAGASPSPSGFLAFPLFALREESSYQKARPEMLEKLQGELARDLRDQNLEKLIEEVKRFKGKKDPQEEAKKLLDSKDVKDKAFLRAVVDALFRNDPKKLEQGYGMRFHSMPAGDLRDRWTIAEDPALKGLREDVRKSRGQSLSELRVDEEVGNELFGPPARPMVGTYEPDRLFLPEEGATGRRVVYWRAEDEPARIRPFKEARPDVVMAWRLDRARALARKEARELAGKVKGQPNKDNLESFLREQNEGPVFTLDGVARLVPPEKQPLMIGTVTYRPYEVPDKLRDKFRYPPANLVDDLMRLDARGDTTTFADRPARHFYVAVLQERSVPPIREFAEVYKKATSSFARDPADPMWDMAVREEQRRYEERVIEQLRRESKAPLDDKGNFVIPEPVRARHASGESGE